LLVIYHWVAGLKVLAYIVFEARGAYLLHLVLLGVEHACWLLGRQGGLMHTILANRAALLVIHIIYSTQVFYQLLLLLDLLD